jgi:hypothetical protein
MDRVFARTASGTASPLREMQNFSHQEFPAMAAMSFCN